VIDTEKTSLEGTHPDEMAAFAQALAVDLIQ
jgi:hypothetical protein